MALVGSSPLLHMHASTEVWMASGSLPCAVDQVQLQGGPLGHGGVMPAHLQLDQQQQVRGKLGA